MPRTLTWRNVDAPRMDLRQYGDASQMMLGGFDRLAQLFNNRGQMLENRATDQAIANDLAITDYDALRAQLAQGAAGLDPNANARAVMEARAAGVDRLMNQRMSEHNLLGKEAQLRFGPEIAALHIAARQGDPETDQMLEQLRQQDGFGYVAGDVSDRYISGLEGHLGDVRDTRDFNYRQSRDAVADDQWMRRFNQTERHHNQRMASARTQLEREQLSAQRGQEAAHGFAAHFARLNPNAEGARSQLLRDDTFRELQRNDPDAANMVLEQFDDLHQSYSSMSETEGMANPVTNRFVGALDSQISAIRMNIDRKRDELFSSDRESAAALRYRENQETYDQTTMDDLQQKTGLSQSELRNILSRNRVPPGVLSAAIDEFGNEGGMFTRNKTFIGQIAAGVGEANRSSRPDRLSNLLSSETSHLTEAMQRMELEKRRAIVDATTGDQSRMDLGGETLQGARDFMGSVNQAFSNRGREEASRGNLSPDASPSEVARQRKREQQEQARAARQQIEQEVRSDPEIQRAQEEWANSNGFTRSMISPVQSEIARRAMQQESERAAQARRDFFRDAAAPYQPLIDANNAFGEAVLYPFTAIAERRRRLQRIGLPPMDELGSTEQSPPAAAVASAQSGNSYTPSSIIFSTLSFGNPARFEQDLNSFTNQQLDSIIEEIQSEIPRVSTDKRRQDLIELLRIAESKRGTS